MARMLASERADWMIVAPEEAQSLAASGLRQVALSDALERLRLLQRALRRRLIDQQRRMRLNRRDPLGAGFDFSELDAMADALWPATAPKDD